MGTGERCCNYDPIPGWRVIDCTTEIVDRAGWCWGCLVRTVKAAEERALAAEQERDHERRIANEWLVQLYDANKAPADRDQQIAALKSRLGQWEASIPDALNEAGRMREEAVIEQVAAWLKREADQHGPFLDGYVLATDIRAGSWRKP